jgi:hypothetical protein
MLACVLAGLGAAWLIGRVPRSAAPYLIAGLVVLAWIGTLRPAALGLEPRIRYGAIRMAPERDALDFHRALKEQGDAGPLIELPVVPKNLVRGSRELLLSAYHHRKTSACYNVSRIPDALFTESRKLPRPAALERVRAMGFTTVVLHHEGDDDRKRALREAFEGAARPEGGGQLVPLHATESLSAYRIGP